MGSNMGCNRHVLEYVPSAFHPPVHAPKILTRYERCPEIPAVQTEHGKTLYREVVLVHVSDVVDGGFAFHYTAGTERL